MTVMSFALAAPLEGCNAMLNFHAAAAPYLWLPREDASLFTFVRWPWESPRLGPCTQTPMASERDIGVFWSATPSPCCEGVGAEIQKAWFGAPPNQMVPDIGVGHCYSGSALSFFRRMSEAAQSVEGLASRIVFSLPCTGI